MKHTHLQILMLIIGIITNKKLMQLAAQPVPQYEWAIQTGGSSITSGQNLSKVIVADKNGNTYSTGSFSGTVDFDPTIGSYTLTSNATADIFVRKLNASGTLVWVKQFKSNYVYPLPGLSYANLGEAMVLDEGGNIYIGGEFMDKTDFDPGVGAHQFTSIPNKSVFQFYGDVFICKLDSMGNFIWTKQIGGNGLEMITSLAYDKRGHIYASGSFLSDTCDFDPGIGVSNLIIKDGNEKGFVVKMDTSGNFSWAKQIQRPLSDTLLSYSNASCVDVDSNGNPYIVGSFNGTIDIDPGIGYKEFTTFGTTNESGQLYVLKLDSLGSFIWANQLNINTPYVQSYIARWYGCLKIDSKNNIYIGGGYTGTVDFDAGIGDYYLTSSGTNAFINKLDADGNFIWVKEFKADNAADVMSLAIDDQGSVYSSGPYNGSTSDFNPGVDVHDITYPPYNYGIFVSKLDSNGNFICAGLSASSTGSSGNYVQTLPGSANGSLAVDNNHNIYTTARFGGMCSFDPSGSNAHTYSAISNFSGGGVGNTADIYVSKLSGCCLKPAIIATTSDSIVGYEDAATLQVTGNNIINYLWTPALGLNCNTCNTIIVTPTITTTYSVVATDVYGCEANASIKINFKNDCGDISIPNVFSPNGDGLNDTLFLKGKCIKTLHLLIFNRWGEKVLDTQNIHGGWDGVYNDIILKNDVYIYYISYETIFGEIINKKGNITLMR